MYESQTFPFKPRPAFAVTCNDINSRNEEAGKRTEHHSHIQPRAFLNFPPEGVMHVNQNEPFCCDADQFIRQSNNMLSVTFKACASSFHGDFTML